MAIYPQSAQKIASAVIYHAPQYKNTHTIWCGYFFNRQLSILPGRFQPSTFDV